MILEALSPREQAQLLYDSLASQDMNARVTAGFAISSLQSWGFPADSYSSLLRLKYDEPISFDTFFRGMASAIGAFRAPNMSAIARSDRERADAVFNIIDLDGSGEIEFSELKVLLISWGMTAKEAEHTIVSLDTNGDGAISRDEFYTNFVPVWRYAWDEIKDSVHRAHLIGAAKHAQVAQVV